MPELSRDSNPPLSAEVVLQIHSLKDERHLRATLEDDSIPFFLMPD